MNAKTTKILIPRNVMQNLLPVLLIALLLVMGCAVNPATKRMEFMVVSEGQEFNIGQKVDKQVREGEGIYLELPRLRDLVKETGEKLGRESDRPTLIYRVEIVDSPDYNAFALPGGFVYVHRGLLERMNSPDELAFVLGHEIAHVAARHSAAQISKAQLLNIGVMGLMVATRGAVQDYGQFLNLGAALAFNKFSRDDEREADHFGVTYMTRAGYNPEAAIRSMNETQRLEAREPSSMELWFSTHPPTSERLDNLETEIRGLRAIRPDVLTRPEKRNEFISLLEGLAVGEWNGNELVSGNSYYNKEFLLSIELPEGWGAQINDEKYTAIFFHPKKGYRAFFNIEPLRSRKTTDEYFRDFERDFTRVGLRRIEGLSTRRDFGHGARAGVYRAHDNGGQSLLIEAIAFSSGANGFSFIGVGKELDFKQFQPEVESLVDRLQFISQKEASALTPPRLRIHRVAEGETWSGIASRYFGSPPGMDRLAEYNGLDPVRDPTPGILLKIPPSMRFL